MAGDEYCGRALRGAGGGCLCALDTEHRGFGLGGMGEADGVGWRAFSIGGAAALREGGGGAGVVEISAISRGGGEAGKQNVLRAFGGGERAGGSGAVGGMAEKFWRVWGDACV